MGSIAGVDRDVCAQLQHPVVLECEISTAARVAGKIAHAQFERGQTAFRFGHIHGDDQLADLRNCIRHSRAVDEITRKEGEAALLWFQQGLER